MKIGFVTQPGHAVLPPAGSLEIWTREVGRRLAPAHDVHVYAPAAADGTAEADGIPYRFCATATAR